MTPVSSEITSLPKSQTTETNIHISRAEIEFFCSCISLTVLCSGTVARNQPYDYYISHTCEVKI
jgi:hypothetical protein